MPRYFYDIHEDNKIFRDEIGQELPDLNAVRTEAQKALPTGWRPEGFLRAGNR